MTRFDVLASSRLSRQPPLAAGASAFDKFTAAAIEALAFRAGVGRTLSEAAQPLVHHSLQDIGRAWCELRGLTVPQVPEDLAGTLLGADVPYHTPGDFPNILAGLANQVLEAPPPYSAASYQNWAFRLPALPDFRPATVIRISEFSELPYHVDGADFTQSRLLEATTWIQVDSYGDEFALTPMMVINDDLGAFTQALQDKQTAHDLTLNRVCVNLLEQNVVLSDSYPLFDANHGNDAAGRHFGPRRAGDDRAKTFAGNPERRAHDDERH